MAFSLRKMFSNIAYFKKPGEMSPDAPPDEDLRSRPSSGELTDIISFEHIEPDSTSKQFATRLNLQDSIKKNTIKKGSLSDTELLTKSLDSMTKKEKRRLKKIKLDIKKANQSLDDNLNRSIEDNVENTPKHVLLECKSSDAFSERLKHFDFNKSFDIFDATFDEQPPPRYEENLDIESLSDTETDISETNEEYNPEIKMCHKVGDPESISSEDDAQLVPSISPESFGDVEVNKNEEDRVALLLNYQLKLAKIECFLHKVLSEFKFHIEVSKILDCKSPDTFRNADHTNLPKVLSEVAFLDNIYRGVSPTGSWNIILEKEDECTKSKLKNQLLSIKQLIEEFMNVYLNKGNTNKGKKCLFMHNRTVTFDIYKGNKVLHKRLRVNNKKKIKHFDYPDLREAMINLFAPESEDTLNISGSVTNLSDLDESDLKCACRCHLHSPSSQTDSGVTKSDVCSMSITSSIGNFSLDSTTLTAFSESLDQIISYSSFQDTTLYTTLLQKPAIERIRFYVQVHSIQLKCEIAEYEYESKNIITFYCPSCETTDNEENDLLKHILGQYHCEKIHFLYKTKYIKACVRSGKEIQPSTVLNPMTMYRDDNKIVCFGDAMYACSLCFENLIVGESFLMAHCSEPEHLERREKLSEIVD